MVETQKADTMLRSYRYNCVARLGIALCILFSCVVGRELPIQGQSNRLRKISPFSQANYIEWARDSRSFVTSSSQPVVSDNWIYYAMDSDTFTDSSIYPFLPQLTTEENALFIRHPDAFSYLSPDGRYLIYAGDTFVSEGYPWMIGDRQTQTTRMMEPPLLEPFSKKDGFDVTWDHGSKSLIMTVCANPFFCSRANAYVYVRGFENGLSSIVFDYEDLTFPVLAGVEYRTLELLDFSGNGRWALLWAGILEDVRKMDGSVHDHLIMYNVMNPQSSFLITDSLGIVPRSFRFATPDGSQILYIDNVGIYRYDWANHTSTLLTTEVNNTKVDLGAFSPDGRWLVFQWNYELYLYDLQGLPETPPSPTPPFPTAYPHPTGIPGGQPACPGGGGEWMWVDGELVFVCGVIWE
ncbi:MAG: PD40 domain-containing protein [Anaerolineales bacterium]|nr:PD40 domain-containing protein [Anaerolineales bacterium]